MKNIDAFNRRYFPQGGGIAWPSSQEDREALARTILGLGFVEAHDSWIGHARRILDGEQESHGRWSERWHAVHRSLANLTDQERKSVVDLVRVAVGGAVFSALVSLDQFPRASLSIRVEDPEAGVGPLELAPTHDDLHDQLFDWLEEFSSEYERA